VLDQVREDPPRGFGNLAGLGEVVDVDVGMGEDAEVFPGWTSLVRVGEEEVELLCGSRAVSAGGRERM
jgi:hypothetical protein